MLIYIQEVIWIEDQGEGTPLSCTIHFSYFRTSFSFHYDWENETILPGALRHFKWYQTCTVTFLYIHYIAWVFQWVLGEEELHCVLRLGCCCYICKRWFLLIHRRVFCPLEGGGGGRHTGTRLTKLINVLAIWSTSTAHATGSPWSQNVNLYCHLIS